MEQQYPSSHRSEIERIAREQAQKERVAHTEGMLPCGEVDIVELEPQPITRSYTDKSYIPELRGNWDEL